MLLGTECSMEKPFSVRDRDAAPYSMHGTFFGSSCMHTQASRLRPWHLWHVIAKDVVFGSWYTDRVSWPGRVGMTRSDPLGRAKLWGGVLDDGNRAAGEQGQVEVDEVALVKGEVARNVLYGGSVELHGLCNDRKQSAR